MSSMTEVTRYLDTMLSVTSIKSTTYHITAAGHPGHPLSLNGSHIADTKVTPPEDGPSQSLKTTQATRCPEEELRKDREELRVIHDNHSWIATRANEDECNHENYNPQQGAKATSPTKQTGQVSCYKTQAPCYKRQDATPLCTCESNG
jgi:hypothetical protein